MDNTPTPTNQPNPTGNETPTTPVPNVSTETTPPSAPAAATEAVETATIVTPTETANITETTTTTTAPATSEPIASQTTATPTTPEPTPVPTATPISAPTSTPSSSTAGSKKKGGLPVGLIIGLAIGGVVLFGAAVAAVIFLFFGGKVDYEATYKSFNAIETSMDEIDYGDCYKAHSRIDSSYTSSSEYNEYITGCVEEFTTLESATNEFAKTSGAKHDDNIKNAFESFKSIFDSIYTKKSDFESQLSIYNTYHEFYLTINNADSNVDSLREAITSAATLFEETKNTSLIEFAKGFREKGLAYVRAIDDRRNGSSVSYSDVYDKMEEFTDYIENNAPEVTDVTGLDFTKMNDLSSAYYDLYEAVSDAYYDHMR